MTLQRIEISEELSPQAKPQVCFDYHFQDNGEPWRCLVYLDDVTLDQFYQKSDFGNICTAVRDCIIEQVSHDTSEKLAIS